MIGDGYTQDSQALHSVPRDTTELGSTTASPARLEWCDDHAIFPRPGAQRLPVSHVGCSLTRVRRATATALLIALLACACACATAAGATITVGPASGGNGTTFVVSFLTPRAAPVRGYHLALRAANTHGGSCVGTLDFYNTKSVRANVRVKFAFTAQAADELCTGTWKVAVRASASGATLLSGGRFTLS